MSKGKKNFLSCIDDGNKGEKIVVEIMTKKGFKCEKSDGKLYHDLTLNDDFIEVKFDKMSKKTGNIAIEYWNSKQDKPSGITATMAKFWAHIVFDKGTDNMKVYMTEVSKLRTWIVKHAPFKKIKGGGDDNADLLIYKMEDIFGDKDLFERIDE